MNLKVNSEINNTIQQNIDKLVSTLIAEKYLWRKKGKLKPIDRKDVQAYVMLDERLFNLMKIIINNDLTPILEYCKAQRYIGSEELSNNDLFVMEKKGKEFIFKNRINKDYNTVISEIDMAKVIELKNLSYNFDEFGDKFCQYLDSTLVKKSSTVSSSELYKHNKETVMKELIEDKGNILNNKYFIQNIVKSMDNVKKELSKLGIHINNTEINRDIVIELIGSDFHLLLSSTISVELLSGRVYYSKYRNLNLKKGYKHRLNTQMNQFSMQYLYPLTEYSKVVTNINDLDDVRNARLYKILSEIKCNNKQLQVIPNKQNSIILNSRVRFSNCELNISANYILYKNSPIFVRAKDVSIMDTIQMIDDALSKMNILNQEELQYVLQLYIVGLNLRIKETSFKKYFN